MPPVTNIAAYQFARLADLKPLREELLALCRARALKGTILLSTEGVNLFVAGAKDDIEALLQREAMVDSYTSILGLNFLDSYSQPIAAFTIVSLKPFADRLTPERSAAAMIRRLNQAMREARGGTFVDARSARRGVREILIEFIERHRDALAA